MDGSISIAAAPTAEKTTTRGDVLHALRNLSMIMADRFKVLDQIDQRFGHNTRTLTMRRRGLLASVRARCQSVFEQMEGGFMSEAEAMKEIGAARERMKAEL